MLEAMIFNIQKFSTEDGPGIRTTVFLKGCPLRCLWCHNPEGQRKHPEIVWYDVKCTGCGECIKVCPEGAITETSEGLVTDRTLCKNCGKCAEVCVSNARELIGKVMTVDQVLDEVNKDKVFYETSGGGITVGGGEPTIFPEFLTELFKKCKEENIHTAIDTCGYVKWETLEEILQYTDLVLYDLKQMDPEKHIEQTGVPLQPILDTLKKIDAMGKPIWIRTPVIPGYTDDEENIRKIAEFLSELKNVKRWDLLPYHKLGEPKMERLDREYALKGLEPPEKEYMLKLKGIADSYKIENVTCGH
ncbi:MAG: glycyl-radical enzyme activating protein [Candidatus Lokiarchaeia archaeon]